MQSTLDAVEAKIFNEAKGELADSNKVRALVVTNPDEAGTLIVKLAALVHVHGTGRAGTGNPDEKIYIFGAPFFYRTRQIELYNQTLRFFNNGSQREGVDFLYGVFDRLLNKAIGLLAFCGLSLTAFGVLAEKLPAPMKGSYSVWFWGVASARGCLAMPSHVFHALDFR